MSDLTEERPSLDTHWSRILYHDLFSARAGDATQGQDALIGDDAATSVVMRQTGVTEGNLSADPERAASALRSQGNSHA
jgi:hypothetical protein